MEEKERENKKASGGEGKKIEAGGSHVDNSAYQSGPLPSPPVNPMDHGPTAETTLRGSPSSDSSPGKFVAPEYQPNMNSK